MPTLQSCVSRCDEDRRRTNAGSVDVEEFVNGVLRYQAQPTGAPARTVIFFHLILARTVIFFFLRDLFGSTGLDVYNSMVLSRKNGQAHPCTTAFTCWC